MKAWSLSTSAHRTPALLHPLTAHSSWAWHHRGAGGASSPALLQHCKLCCCYLCARTLTGARLPPTRTDAPSDPVLKKVFKGYCKLRLGQGRQMGSSVQQMNAAQFNRMCHDAGISEPAGEGPGRACCVGMLVHTTTLSRLLPVAQWHHYGTSRCIVV